MNVFDERKASGIAEAALGLCVPRAKLAGGLS